MPPAKQTVGQIIACSHSAALHYLNTCVLTSLSCWRWHTVSTAALQSAILSTTIATGGACAALLLLCGFCCDLVYV